jgi:hypothetical protein
MKISILASLRVGLAALFKMRSLDNVSGNGAHTDRARRIRGRATLLFLCIGVMGPVARAANISSCQTIETNGNYTVTQDLKVTTITTNSPNCLIISHSDVGIDLGGHTITGLGNGTGSGITDSSAVGGSMQSTIIVANGKIKGFETGILLNTDITISQMDVSQNTGNGIAIFDGAVTNTRSDQNGGSGISITDTGAVSDSEASYNGSEGIGLGGNSYVNNTSTNNNYGDGMYFGGNSGSVSNSESNGNGGYGMYVYGNFIAILDSQANNNANGMYFYSGGPHFFVENSEANNNKRTGINFPGINTEDFLSGNNVGGNNLGIVLGCSGSAFGNDARNNTQGNLVSSSNCTVLLDNEGF